MGRVYGKHSILGTETSDGSNYQGGGFNFLKVLFLNILINLNKKKLAMDPILCHYSNWGYRIVLQKQENNKKGPKINTNHFLKKQIMNDL